MAPHLVDEYSGDTLQTNMRMVKYYASLYTLELYCGGSLLQRMLLD